MLSRYDLKDYRLLKGLSLRDVARYCDVSAQMIGSVERGEYALTESTYKEIVKGINGAAQAVFRGTFDEDKCKEKEDKKPGARAKTVAREKTAGTTAKRA